MKSDQVDWRIWAAVGAAATIAAGAMISQWLRRPADPDETERKRRSYVNQIGRIVEGDGVRVRGTDGEWLATDRPGWEHFT